MLEGIRCAFEEIQARREKHLIREKQMEYLKLLIDEAYVGSMRHWNEDDRDPKQLKIGKHVNLDVDQRVAVLKIGSSPLQDSRFLCLQYKPGKPGEASFDVWSANDDLEAPFRESDLTADQAKEVIQRYINQEILSKLAKDRAAAAMFDEVKEGLRPQVRNTAIVLGGATALLGGLDLVVGKNDAEEKPPQPEKIKEQLKQDAKPAPGEAQVSQIAGTNYVAVMSTLDI